MEDKNEKPGGGVGTNVGGDGFVSSSATSAGGATGANNDGGLNSSQPASPAQIPFSAAADVSQNSYMGVDGSGVNTTSPSQYQNPFSTDGGPIQVQRPVYNNNNNYYTQMVGENPYTRKFKFANIAPAITTPIIGIISTYFCVLIFLPLSLIASHTDIEKLDKFGPIGNGGLAVSVPLATLCIGVCYFECVLCCVNVKPGCVMAWLILNGLISFLLFLHLIFLVILMAHLHTLFEGIDDDDDDDDDVEIRRHKLSWDTFQFDSGDFHTGGANERENQKEAERRVLSYSYYIVVAALVIGIICLVLRCLSFAYVLYIRKRLVSQNDTVYGGGALSFNPDQYPLVQGGPSVTTGLYDPSYPPAPPPYSQPQQLSSTHTL